MDYSQGIYFFYEVQEMLSILLTAEEKYNYAYYLEYPPSIKEKLYLDNSYHFEVFKIAVWKIACLELSKLFKCKFDKGVMKVNNRFRKFDKEVYNFLSLIDDLEKGKWGEVPHFIELDVFKSKINNLAKTVENLFVYRDKAYAHTDLNKPQKQEIELRFGELYTMIELSKQIIEFLFRKVIKRNSVLTIKEFKESDFDIIKKLADLQT